MPGRVPLTLATFVLLSGIYLAYASLVGPLVRSPKLARIAVGPTTQQTVGGPPTENVEFATRYFPDTRWVREAAYQMRTDRLFVYAEKSERSFELDGSVRFTPFAMILKQGADKEPLRILATSALVRFENTFGINEDDPTPGKVALAVLEKDVLVRGHDGLELTGRNFVYDAEAAHVRSDEPIAFTLGPHGGTADGFEVRFRRARKSQSNNDFGLAGIDSIQLLEHVTMNFVEGETKDFTAKLRPASEKSQSPDKKQHKHARIKCNNGFEFLPRANTATFRGTVQVARQTPGLNDLDTLRCALLRLVFKPENPEPTDPANDDEFQGIDSNLVFQRLHATGNYVALESPSREFGAYQITDLSYDAQQRLVVLTNPDGVRIIRQHDTMRCPRITLQESADDREITTAWCRGRGILERRDPDSRRVVFSATWLKHLHKFVDPQDPSHDVLELQQEASVQVRELQQDAPARQPLAVTGLSADLIKVWIPRSDSKHLGRELREQPETPTNTPRPRPTRMLALKNVHLTNAELIGNTDRLEVWFEYLSDPGPWPRKTTVDSANPGAAHQGAPADSSVQLDSPRAGGQIFASLDDPLKPTARAKRRKADNDAPLHVNAELIQVRVIDGELFAQPQVANVVATGDVTVSQEQDPDVAPFVMTGKTLQINRYSPNHEVAAITGQPAQVQAQGYSIEGENINLDRAQNLTWIKGAGVLRMPVKSDLDGNKLDRPQLVNLHWTEKMSFDGQAAGFVGNVQAIMQSNRMFCQEMLVRLKDRISFADTKEKKRENEILSLECRNGVRFDSLEHDEAGKLIGIRYGQFATLDRDHTTGKTDAQGPGWLESWKRGQAKRAGLTASSVAQANTPLKSTGGKWEYMRIDFAGTATGIIHANDADNEHYMTFHDQIQVVYGPVGDHEETIDPDNLPNGAGWMRCKKLTFIHHAENLGRPAYNDILAFGNVVLEGQGMRDVKGQHFVAKADSISYDESKGLYVMRSLGSLEARLWQQTGIGEQPSEVKAQKFEFIPHLNVLNAFGAGPSQAIQ